MEKSPGLIHNVMRFETIRVAPPPAGYTGPAYYGNGLYALQGVPGVFRRVKRQGGGVRLTVPGAILGFFQGKAVELVPADDISFELKEAGYLRQSAALALLDATAPPAPPPEPDPLGVLRERMAPAAGLIPPVVGPPAGAGLAEAERAAQSVPAALAGTAPPVVRMPAEQVKDAAGNGSPAVPEPPKAKKPKSKKDKDEND